MPNRSRTALYPIGRLRPNPRPNVCSLSLFVAKSSVLFSSQRPLCDPLSRSVGEDGLSRYAIIPLTPVTPSASLLLLKRLAGESGHASWRIGTRELAFSEEPSSTTGPFGARNQSVTAVSRGDVL